MILADPVVAGSSALHEMSGPFGAERSARRHVVPRSTGSAWWSGWNDRRGAPDRAVPALAWYVAELIARLGAGDPPALDRLRTIVGSRRARIGLEREVVETWFDEDGSWWSTTSTVDGRGARSTVDGEGHTLDEVVLALLAGDLEVTDAILDGDIEVRGSVEAVAAMFAAVDILIDCATRVPGVRELSEHYAVGAPLACGHGRLAAPATAWPPQLVDPAEDEMLERLGLHGPLGCGTPGDSRPH